MAIVCRECGEEISAPGGDVCGNCSDVVIYVWPDGLWVEAYEYCETADAWRGDDFQQITVPLRDAEDIDVYVDELMNK